MIGTELKDITILLDQVDLIKSKYDDLAELTGENFNVFNILGIYSDELSHSAFIANLLNAKGRHGQKDTFLKLFIEKIRSTNKFNEETKQFDILRSFDTGSSHAVVEKHIGTVNYENAEGGRIDIVINDGRSNIIIENKIWAGDQHQQLLRYNNEDKNAPIIYLTLDGKEPSIHSKGHLENGKEFICVSYQNNIVNWLESCIKEMANKPVIKETLNQYLHLIKQLTNQTENSKMEKEIITIVTKNKENLKAFETIIESVNKVRKTIIEEEFVNDILIRISEKHNLDLKVDEGFYYGATYSGFSFSNQELKKKNINIRFDFQSSNFRNALLGLVYIDKNKRNDMSYINLQTNFKSKFDNVVSNENFACYLIQSKWTTNFENLGSLNKLRDLKFENLKNDLRNDMEFIVSNLLNISTTNCT